MGAVDVSKFVLGMDKLKDPFFDAPPKAKPKVTYAEILVNNTNNLSLDHGTGNNQNKDFFTEMKKPPQPNPINWGDGNILQE